MGTPTKDYLTDVLTSVMVYKVIKKLRVFIYIVKLIGEHCCITLQIVCGYIHLWQSQKGNLFTKRGGIFKLKLLERLVLYFFFQGAKLTMYKTQGLVNWDKNVKVYECVTNHLCIIKEIYTNSYTLTFFYIENQCVPLLFTESAMVKTILNIILLLFSLFSKIHTK